jgi:hypothetical protein
MQSDSKRIRFENLNRTESIFSYFLVFVSRWIINTLSWDVKRSNIRNCKRSLIKLKSEWICLINCFLKCWERWQQDIECKLIPGTSPTTWRVNLLRLVTTWSLGNRLRQRPSPHLEPAVWEVLPWHELLRDDFNNLLFYQAIVPCSGDPPQVFA